MTRYVFKAVNGKSLAISGLKPERSDAGGLRLICEIPGCFLTPRARAVPGGHARGWKLQWRGRGIEEATGRFIGQLVDMQFHDVTADLGPLGIAVLEAGRLAFLRQTRRDFPEEFDRFERVGSQPQWQMEPSSAPNPSDRSIASQP